MIFGELIQHETSGRSEVKIWQHDADTRIERHFSDYEERVRYRVWDSRDPHGLSVSGEVTTPSRQYDDRTTSSQGTVNWSAMGSRDTPTALTYARLISITAYVVDEEAREQRKLDDDRLAERAKNVELSRIASEAEVKRVREVSVEVGTDLARAILRFKGKGLPSQKWVYDKVIALRDTAQVNSNIIDFYENVTKHANDHFSFVGSDLNLQYVHGKDRSFHTTSHVFLVKKG